MAARTAIELLKMLATRSGVKNVFRQNLDDTFGKDEVKEGIRIITQREKNPELAKMFYKADESLEDDLVNLLETRYMGSERLMAHPFSFNRRGPGAADRYKQINDSGMRLTDLPGGPADKNLYAKHFGEMKDSTAGVSGERVYKNTRPTILDEVPTEKVDDVIEGKLIEDSLYDTSIADIPLINRMMKETGKTETEIREAIVDMANEGYESGSSKLMRMSDDDRLRAYISNKQAVPRETEEFVDDMFERLDYTKPLDTGDDILANMRKMEAEVTAMKEIAEAEQMQYAQGMDAFRRMLDDGEDPGEALEFLKNVFKRTENADGGRVGMALGGAAKGIMEAIRLAARGIKPFGKKQTYKQNVKTMGLSNFDQVEVITSKQIDELRNANDVEGLLGMLEDVVSGKKFGMANPAQRKILQENIEEALGDIPLNKDSRERLSEEYFNMMEYYKPDPKETGKVIPFKPREKKYSGGIAGILRQLLRRSGMSAPDKVADKKQIQNVIRDPNTELERRYVEGFDGTPPTPANRMTIDEIRDMVQKDPRYDKLTAKQMDEVIIKETIRADFAYNMGIKAEDVGDDIVEMLYRERYQNRFGFIGGGIVNTLAAPDATQAQQNTMSPYTQEVMRASQEAMANPMRQRLMNEYMSSPAFKEAQERSQQFQLRQAENDQARRMAYMDAEQGLADTYAGMEDFQQVGYGLDKRIDQIGRGLAMGQQKIREQIAQANPNQPQTGFQSQNVLNIGGLGNLFGLRS